MEVEALCRWLETLRSQRTNYESLFDDAARFVWPNQKDFTARRTPGERRTDEIYDDTPVDAAKKYAAVIEALVARRGTRWHGLKAIDPNLQKNEKVRAYFKEVTDLLFGLREDRESGCYAALGQCFRALGVFGNDALFVDDRYEHGRKVGVRYKAIDFRNIYLARDWQDGIAAVFRETELTASDIVSRYDAARVPGHIAERAKTRPFDLFTVWLAIWKNPEHAPERFASKPWLAAEFMETPKAMLLEGGYEELPLICSRGEVAVGEVYGRGPAIDVLHTIKTVNAMWKTLLRAAHKAADPPLLVRDDGILAVKNAVRLQPGSLTRGGIDASGRRMVDTLYNGTNALAANLEVMAHLESKIERAFLVDLFTLLVERPQMTAAEILERSAEKGVFIGPIVGDQQTQKLAPMIERELGLAFRQRRLPPMPQELQEAGGLYLLEYETPAAQMQRAGDVRTIEEWLASVAAIAERDPRVAEIPDLDKAIRKLAELRGVPADLVRDEKTVDRLRAVQMRVSAMRDAIEAAPAVAGAVRDLSQAQGPPAAA